MLGAVCLCVLAMALPCWTVHFTTCDEFGRGVNFDPVNAVGEWFIVYIFEDYKGNFTEKHTIKELTSSQLEQYDQILRGYSKDKLKLESKRSISPPAGTEVDVIMVSQDYAGNLEAYITRKHYSGSTDEPVPNPGPHRLKWKIVDGFLVTMWCSSQSITVLSKTTTPDEDKLQRAVDSLHIEPPTGRRVYPNLLTLL